MSIKIYVKYVKNNRDFHTTKLNLPTGNLDKKTGEDTLDLLQQCSEQFGQTLIVVTHDLEIARQADVIVHIEDGKIIL